jgi:U6 snRNA-associated Sm-like protein LSm4
MPECYIRGSTIKYLRIPDEVIDMVKEDVQAKARNRTDINKQGRGPGQRQGGPGGAGGPRNNQNNRPNFPNRNNPNARPGLGANKNPLQKKPWAGDDSDLSDFKDYYV